MSGSKLLYARPAYAWHRDKWHKTAEQAEARAHAIRARLMKAGFSLSAIRRNHLDNPFMRADCRKVMMNAVQECEKTNYGKLTRLQPRRAA